ncbi:hypothetical protein [Eggerthella sinensis]|uniref:hypothetical protein n=1 Tax=Eggerthella sinensis TaxID=242230 RepID=UPI0022E4FC43|nr:hypothetical protein [Eggerthella sinensis]
MKVGGGSPSIMSPDKLGELLLDLRVLFDLADDCEVSLEAVPHTVGVPSLTGWGQGKVNRVILRADSVQPEELVALDRPFDSVQVQNALLFLDKFHLGNVDVALRYGIPGQTEASLMRTLRSVAGIEPAHLHARAPARRRRGRARRRGAAPPLRCRVRAPFLVRVRPVRSRPLRPRRAPS